MHDVTSVKYKKKVYLHPFVGFIFSLLKYGVGSVYLCIMDSAQCSNTAELRVTHSAFSLFVRNHR